MTTQTPESQARDILDRLGVQNSQDYSAGDLVEIANLIAERDDLRDVAIIVENHIAAMDYELHEAQDLAEHNGAALARALIELQRLQPKGDL